MKNAKRILSVMLALALGFGLLIPAFAEEAPPAEEEQSFWMDVLEVVLGIVGVLLMGGLFIGLVAGLLFYLFNPIIGPLVFGAVMSPFMIIAAILFIFS